MSRPWALLAAFTSLAIIGCGNNGNQTGTAEAPAGGSGSGSKMKLVFIPKQSGNTYFDEIDRGFKDAAKKLDIDYQNVAPSTGDATSQIPIITDQIQRGVDVIAISPNSPDALNSVLDQAKAKGITVITVDADLVKNESHRDVAVLPVNFEEVGPSQVELLAKQIGYGGEIAFLSATADAPNQNAWLASMKEVLKQPKYGRMHLVDTVYGDDEPQKSTTECEGLLAKHPNLRGIIAPTSVGLAASAVVVQRAGVYPAGAHAVGGGLVLTGLSTPNQVKKFVKDGVVTNFQLWSPYDEGVLAAYLAQQIHSKKVTPKAGTELDVPGLGRRGFTPKLEMVAGHLLTFDKSNIEKFEF